jgi:mannose-6-phosphate isomerase-like protein (cupin superfamily)
MKYSIHKSDSKLLDLPGRDVRVFVGLDRLQSESLTVGLTEVPPESSMTPHSHADKEEVIFITEGSGEAVVGDSVEPLEPNTAVVFPIGVEHVVHNRSKNPMKFVFMFNPPNDFK